LVFKNKKSPLWTGGIEMLLEKLGIYGWKEKDENLVFSSLLTGDPLLLIGNHGCAKTHIANKVGQALGRKSLVYDASKAMFEDVLGYPNIEKLKQGIVEYIPSNVTIWDKELVLIDELNRAIPELQSKWLEIIRSRKIMGFETQVKWVWAAMNPMTYSATQALDEALIGRFALFVYPPDVLQMEENDRIKVTGHINGDDAPAMGVWLDGSSAGTVPKESIGDVGERLNMMFPKAARHFRRLQSELVTLSVFLARFADLLLKETKGEISLDGRRLGFIYRNILSTRSVELAKAEIFGSSLGSFTDSARYVVASSIPVGLNEGSIKKEEALHKMEICFDLLGSFFEEGSDLRKVDTIYELFTTKDLMRKAEILLQANLGEFVNSKAWNDLVNDGIDITVLAYTALQVEARRPGIIPRELLESLSRKISGEKLSTGFIKSLQGDAVEYIDGVEALLEQDTDLGKIVAFSHVSKLTEKENITPKDIERTRESIVRDIETFEGLIGTTNQQKTIGGEIQCVLSN
jgi:hypothetical protein